MLAELPVGTSLIPERVTVDAVLFEAAIIESRLGEMVVMVVVVVAVVGEKGEKGAVVDVKIVVVEVVWVTVVSCRVDTFAVRVDSFEVVSVAEVGEDLISLGTCVLLAFCAYEDVVRVGE